MMKIVDVLKCLVVTLLFVAGAAAHGAADDGTIVQQKPCFANPLKTYENYLERVQGAYRQEASAATSEGFRQAPAVAPHAREPVERRLAYEGFECRSIVYLSDGLKIAGYLWKPKDVDGKKLPLIVYNRGGNRSFGRLYPWIDFGFYEYLRQGFVVLASQYRGGADSEGNDEYGGADVHDVTNLIPLARSLGYVDMNNVFMLGWSRGAMMTHLALKSGMKVNAAAVVSGANDPLVTVTKRRSIAQVWQELSANLPEQGDAALRERSVVYWPEKINAPLLILHGGADWREDPEKSRELARRLDELGKANELVIYPGDDHGLSHHKAASEQKIVAWFKQHMKP
jgi:dipeptidyl aminopeptidase/acylaminoacyl peptidase